MPEDKNNNILHKPGDEAPCVKCLPGKCEPCLQTPAPHRRSGEQHTAAVPALSRWRQEDPKFKASLATQRLAGHPRLHGTLSQNDDAGGNYDNTVMIYHME